MRRNCFSPVPGFLSLCLACITAGVPSVRAQISVGPVGVGPLTFDSAPAATEFSTGVLLGVGPTYSNLVSLNAGVASVDERIIAGTLTTTSEATPGTYAGGMRYNSQLRLIQSRPATDSTNAAGVLLGRFVNNAGHNLSAVRIVYSFVTRDPVPGELPGLYVYWSLTGLPDSWQPIPELSGSEVTGDYLALVNLGNWAPGSSLYVLWADDNANSLTDPSYTIDNVSVLISFPPPVIISQPQSTNVAVGQTIRLSVVARGFGLQYHWFKDGMPLDPLVNPSVLQPTLTISNAQVADGGSYFCTVSVFGGGAISDAATVNVTEAAIPLNSIQTLDVQPGPSNWATRNVGGLSGSIVSPEALDAAIQTNEVSTLSNALQITSGSANSGLAQWNSIGRQIVMRPVGVAYNVLLAKLQNTSGHDLASVAVGYDFGNPAPAPGAEDPGLNGWRAYYSLTGQAGTWLLIPEFSISQPGSPGAVIPLGSWPAGSLLYVLWADDNGSGSDSAFTIDNFIALESLPPPPPPRIEPPGTNILCDGTIRFTAVAIGVGLSYRWYKDGQPIDPVSNPTAMQATLIVTNAQFMDAGDYGVTVQNAAGSAWSDVATVVIACDPIPPRFVFAYDIPDNPRGFRVGVDKLLCTNEFFCGSDATRPYNWIIESTSFSSFLEVESVTISGTNLEFATVGPRVAGETYRIRPADDGTGVSAISDLFGNRMPSWYSITSNPALLFRQGRNGYSGTQDTEIHEGDLADTVLGAATQIHVDDDEGGVAQGLLRFDNVFGKGSGQIPIGARILSATLSLAQLDRGLPVTVHRMLIPWDQTLATWNGFTDGVAADGTEARGSADTVIVSGASDGIDVTASAQAWADGEANHGWFLQSTGTDGFTFASSESGQPPSLTVVLRPPDPCIMYITQHPASLTVNEGQSFTLSPRVGSAHCFPIYQWTKNGVDIPGATGQTYTVPMACISDAGVYRLRVTSGSVSMTSNPAVVTVQDDIVRPVLTGAFGSLDGTNITLTFSKVMNATNAPDNSHYSLDPPVTVTAAVLSPDGRTVTLATSPRSPLTSYTLRIQDVTDNRAVCVGSIGNVISPNPTFVPLTGVRVDVPWDSEWLYSTNSQDATLSTPTPWYAPNFSPGPDWMTGWALFGTETSAGIVAQFPTPLLTPIPPNTNTPPDQITTYFRKQIDLPPLPPGATYALCHFIDDGAVFYLDGVEIGRVSMTNAAPILFMNRAAAALEASVACFPFVASTGQHTLAVEVHQAGPATSTDILFGAQLATLTEAPQLDIEPPIVSWKADSSWELLTSSNVAGPYAPVAASPFATLGTHHAAPTNPAAFFRLRFNGVAK